MYYKQMLLKRKSGAFVSCMLILAFVASSTHAVAGSFEASFPETITANHLSNLIGCHFGTSTTTYKPPTKCEIKSTGTGSPVYLIGDSQADAFSEAVVGAVQKIGRPTFLYTASSCLIFPESKFIAPEKFDPYFPWLEHHTFDHCQTYLSKTIKWLTTAKPGLLIVAQFDQLFWDSNFKIVYKGKTLANQKDKLSAFTDSFGRFTQMLNSRGFRVLIVQSIPTYRNPAPIWDPTKCSKAEISKCFATSPRSTINKLQLQSRGMFAKLARTQVVTILDLRDHFCSSTICSTKVDGINAYKDATHVSVLESKYLQKNFATAISQLRE
jgi:hypothetical protein